MRGKREVKESYRSAEPPRRRPEVRIGRYRHEFGDSALLPPPCDPRSESDISIVEHANCIKGIIDELL